jgi:2-keto-3-deoxy-L-rhamnonate aldolase RhmA
MIPELDKARKFKAKLRAGEVCVGAQLALTDPAVVEIFGRAGYDWLVVDTEHAPHTVLSVRNMLQAGVHSPSIVIARPVKLDSDIIRQYLDVGSPGLLCPFINTGEDASQLVHACRYPPKGTRGYGPRRAGVYGFDADEYFREANENIICIPIIESAQSVENIEEIVSVDGIDGITLGPMDLSISLGIFKQFEHPTYLSVIERVRKACEKYKKAMGTACYSYKHAVRCMDQGYTLLLVGGDDQFIASEACRWLDIVREKGEKHQ